MRCWSCPQVKEEAGTKQELQDRLRGCRDTLDERCKKRLGENLQRINHKLQEKNTLLQEGFSEKAMELGRVAYRLGDESHMP